MAELIQKAVEWGKLSAKFKKQWGSVDNLDPTRWVAQPKYDGCHVIIDTDSGRVFSRANEDVRSMDHILDMLPKGYVFQGEAYIRNTPFKDISGAFRRHANQPQLKAVLYDLHRPDEFYNGLNETQYHARHSELFGLLRNVPGFGWVATNLNMPGITHSELAARYVAAGGYDGLILRDTLSYWEAGLAREGQIIKVKPSVSLDLRVEEVLKATGEKTGRDVFTLLVSYRGVKTTVGSGVPHKEEDLPLPGQIVEVECMAVNTNNTLREPRFKGIRYDKTEPDR